MSMSLSPRMAAPLREQVTIALRKEIIEGEILPGTRLLEKTLCDKYDVSRTVIREALRQLESESLVSMRPGHGPEVAQLTADDIHALYEVRSELEGLATEMFVKRASAEYMDRMIQFGKNLKQSYLKASVQERGETKNEFYEILLGGAGNPVLTSMLEQLHARIGIFRYFAFVDEHRTEISYLEIASIVKEITEEKDAAAARRASEHHIFLAGELAILEYNKRYGQSD